MRNKSQSPSMRKPNDVKAHFRFLLSVSLLPFSQAASVASVIQTRGAAMPLSQHSSIPLDNKNCLIVNTIFLANLSQTIVSFERVFEQRIAHVFCRRQAVFAHYAVMLPSFFLIAAIINPIGVQEESVPRTHQR